jgi:STAS domain
MHQSLSPVPSRSVLSTIVAGWRRVLTLLRPARPAGQITYSQQPPAVADRGLVVGVIDDPDTAMRLVSVRGRVTPTSIGTLARALAEVRDHARLHLDLTDAEFADSSVLRVLGGLLDQLDDRRVHLRIVGLGRLAKLPLD